MSEQQTREVAEYKKKAVDELVKLMQSHKSIGIINMKGMPAPQLQRMRAQFRGKALIYMSKLRLMKLAVEKAKATKKGLEMLEEFIKGMPALLLTNENPFKIASAINKSKTPAPAKAGQTAIKDIIISQGPTPFAPGPIISELGAIGLKTGVEAGKVAIKEEFVAAKEGDKISPKIADILTKLSIEPMEVGLNLVAIYEDGTIYKKDVLAFDEELFTKMIKEAAAESKALAIEIGHITKETIGMLLGKAHIIAENINASLKLPEAKEDVKEEKKGKIKEETETKPEEIKEEKELKEEKPEPETKPEPVKEEPKKQVPSAYDLAKKKQEKVGDMEEKDEAKKIKTKISEDFKNDVKEEKERRDLVFEKSTKDVENLTEQLKRKGTLRNQSGG